MNLKFTTTLNFSIVTFKVEVFHNDLD